MDLFKKVQEIEKDMPALYTHDKKKAADTPIFCKFFDPCGSWTWYVTEGEKETNEGNVDYRFFGYVRGFENEYGYFMLSQLAEVKGSLGIGIEMDLFFGKHMLSEAIERAI